LNIATFTLGPFETNSYLAFCPETRKGVIIDAAFEVSVLLVAVKHKGLEIVHVVSTHGHIDHVCGTGLAREVTGATFLMHQGDLEILLHPERDFLLMLGLEDYVPVKPDGFLFEGQDIAFGNESLRVVHTPGHTPGGVCLLGKGLLFTGDTLFAGSVGRTDLSGGNQEELIRSIRGKILCLPDETVIQPGHGSATTIGEERRSNPFLG